MGTLDDAIREHLELKKRSGASEEEVKRLESEAFGPVRREPAAPAPAAADDEEDLEPPTTVVPREPEQEPEAESDAEPVAEEQEVAPPEPFLSAPPPAPATSRSWLEDEHDEADGPPAGGSTSEFTAADAEDASGRPPSDYVAPDDEGEDLLEETPDFLQETPEHDRLWFEQRPPRDFDFDQ